MNSFTHPAGWCQLVGVGSAAPRAHGSPEPEIPGCWRRVEGDVVAEGLELGDGLLAGAVGVAPDEEVTAKIAVVAVLGEQLPDNHQDGVAHGDRGLLLADAAG